MTDVTETADTTPASSETASASTKANRPGALRGDVSLTLHTQFAVNAFNGRPPTDDGVRAIPGLYRFANCLDQIAVGVVSDDPYADLALVQVDKLMDRAETILTTRHDLFRDKLGSSSRMSVAIASSTDPHVVTLKLRSPYAHWAARLIGRLDEVAVAALSAHHVGLIGSAALDAAMRECMRVIRAPFHGAARYRFSGVTRVDMEQQTGRVKEVVAERGQVPDEIIDRTLRPRFQMSPKAH